MEGRPCHLRLSQDALQPLEALGPHGRVRSHDDQVGGQSAGHKHADDRCHWALADQGITACIPSKANRKVPIPHDLVLYRQRHRIENAFGRIKDWRRVATRYDRCPIVYLSAYALTALVIFWL